MVALSDCDDIEMRTWQSRPSRGAQSAMADLEDYEQMERLCYASNTSNTDFQPFAFKTAFNADLESTCPSESVQSGACQQMRQASGSTGFATSGTGTFALEEELEIPDSYVERMDKLTSLLLHYDRSVDETIKDLQLVVDDYHKEIGGCLDLASWLRLTSTDFQRFVRRSLGESLMPEDGLESEDERMQPKRLLHRRGHVNLTIDTQPDYVEEDECSPSPFNTDTDILSVRGEWLTVRYPQSPYVFYYNKVTGTSQWDKRNTPFCSPSIQRCSVGGHGKRSLSVKRDFSPESPSLNNYVEGRYSVSPTPVPRARFHNQHYATRESMGNSPAYTPDDRLSPSPPCRILPSHLLHSIVVPAPRIASRSASLVRESDNVPDIDAVSLPGGTPVSLEAGFPSPAVEPVEHCAAAKKRERKKAQKKRNRERTRQLREQGVEHSDLTVEQQEEVLKKIERDAAKRRQRKREQRRRRQARQREEAPDTTGQPINDTLTNITSRGVESVFSTPPHIHRLM